MQDEFQNALKPSQISEAGKLILRYPYYAEIINPLLVYIYENGGESHTIRSKITYKPLADYFDLTETDRLRPEDEILKNGRKSPYWNLLVQRAKDSVYLRYIMPAARGTWPLTNQGIGFAQQLIKNKYASLNQANIHLSEGEKTTYLSTKYERSIIARKICINKYGYKCSACGINLADKYGPIGEDYIHIHHIVPISSIGKNYIINPETDLVPVCPNCHAMLHRKNAPLTVDELKQMLKKAEEQKQSKAQPIQTQD
jgi:5-methylcytosine-specific restriction protein A